eukprot:gene20231-biopygen29021
MSRASNLPKDLMADVLLRACRLGAATSNLSAVCRSWHSVVAQNLADLLIASHRGAMSQALCRALAHGKYVVAYELASQPQSVKDSSLASFLAAYHGRADLVQLLLDAPQEALVDAAKLGHTEIVHALLNAPQHRAHADCLRGRPLLGAVAGGHVEIVGLLLGAQEHAAQADCQSGQAFVLAARSGHVEIMRMLLTAPHDAAQARRASAQDAAIAPPTPVHQPSTSSSADNESTAPPSPTLDGEPSDI